MNCVNIKQQKSYKFIYFPSLSIDKLSDFIELCKCVNARGINPCTAMVWYQTWVSTSSPPQSIAIDARYRQTDCLATIHDCKVDSRREKDAFHFTFEIEHCKIDHFACQFGTIIILIANHKTIMLFRYIVSPFIFAFLQNTMSQSRAHTLKSPLKFIYISDDAWLVIKNIGALSLTLSHSLTSLYSILEMA